MALIDELAAVLNCASAENGSDTPDFILAAYLSDCLAAWNRNVTAREAWYGRQPRAETMPLPAPPEGWQPETQEKS